MLFFTSTFMATPVVASVHLTKRAGQG
jgi:hypothetical protein